jgi:hypothetical protein
VCVCVCGWVSVLTGYLLGGWWMEDPAWRQFRFSVGAPDAEAKFKAAVGLAQAKNANARRYPSLYVRVERLVVCAVLIFGLCRRSMGRR